MVEDEELIFRAEVGSIGQSDIRNVLECFFGDGAWAFFVEFILVDIIDITKENDRRIGRERVEERCRYIRLENHIRFIDRLPCIDRRAVKREALLQIFGIDCAHSVGQVVPCPLDVREAQIDEFDLILFAVRKKLVDIVYKFTH